MEAVNASTMAESPLTVIGPEPGWMSADPETLTWSWKAAEIRIELRKVSCLIERADINLSSRIATGELNGPVVGAEIALSREEAPSSVFKRIRQASKA